MASSLISILMPVYNCELYIGDAIQSILNQTYRNFEFIIIDDGSTDDTSEIISSYSDSRIKYCRLEHTGIPASLNFGLSKAKGELIARMDGDDISLKDRLQKQYDYLIQNERVHLVGTNFKYIDEFSKEIFYKKFTEEHEDIAFSMPIVASVLHSTILTYKKVLSEVGNYNSKYLHVEDQELFLRLISKGYRMYNLQEPLYLYRIRSDNKEKQILQRKTAYECGYQYLIEYYAEENSKNKIFEKNLRLGLLEYYNSSISKSRKYLLTCLRIYPLRFKKVLRYLPFTFLGSKFLNKIRAKGISSGMNRFLNKTFKIDTYKIR